MSTAPNSGRKLVNAKGSTLVVFAFLALTILPAFVAFVLTPQDAQVVTNVQGWNGCVYTVRRGDDLFRIGLRYGVSYHYLAQLNGIPNPNYIWAGQLISVPCGPVKYASYRPAPKPAEPWPCPWSGASTWSWCQPFDIPPNCGQTIQYLVQPGDNLFRIAVYNGSTIPWIRTQNDLWGKVLRPGVTLNVPCYQFVTYGPNVWTPTPGGPNIVTATPQQPTAAPIPNLIRMRNSKFNPPTLTVRVGSTVTWENRDGQDGLTYTVTSGANGQPDGQFNSGPIAPGGTFIFTFNTPGSYAYFSETDPQNMVGEIIVNP